MRTLIATSMILAACGHGSSGGKDASKSETSGADPYHSLAVADSTKLPECTTEAEGWLVYLRAEAEFEVCSSGLWSTVDIKGEKGDEGDSGTTATAQTVATDPNVKVFNILDASGTKVGTVTDVDPLTVTIDGTNQTVKLKSLADGFTGQDATAYCFSLKADCSGTCDVVYSPTATKAESIVMSGSTVFLLDHNWEGHVGPGNTASFYKAKLTDGGSCDTDPANFPMLSVSTVRHEFISKTFSLPFSQVAQ